MLNKGNKIGHVKSDHLCWDMPASWIISSGVWILDLKITWRSYWQLMSMLWIGEGSCGQMATL